MSAADQQQDSMRHHERLKQLALGMAFAAFAIVILASVASERLG